VPVPTVRAVVDDLDGAAGVGAPFYLMDKVEGVILKTTSDNAGHDRETLHSVGVGLAHVLADLHSVDFEAAGLAAFGRPDGYLERQVARWTKQLESSRSRDLPEVERLGRALAASIPESGAASVIHGDFRLDNCIVDPRSLRIAAVLDWEMATLGDPLADLALFALYYVMPSLDPTIAEVHASSVDVGAGYPELPELVDAYAARRGIPVPDLSWYLAFSAFKVAGITESIHYRYLAGATVGEHFDRMGELTTPVAAAGLDFLAHRRVA
jgi:aminoglycoside phosphotransferase (APT) family kinase protein